MALRSLVKCRLLKISSGKAKFEPFIRKIPSYGKKNNPILHKPSEKLSLNYSLEYSGIREKALLAKESNQNNSDWGGSEAAKLIIHLQDNILDIIKEYDSLMVFFYTTWCKHCTQMKSTYGQAAVKMMKDGIPGHLGAIDLTKRLSIADIFDIVAVPVLKYFRNGEYIMLYKDKRTVDDIVNFMKNPPETPYIISKIDV